MRPLVAAVVVVLGAGCVRAPSAVAERPPSGPRPEEVALEDAFGELVRWVTANPGTLPSGQMPICVVLGDASDPSAGTVRRLRSQWRWVEPASSCPYKDRQVLIVAADSGEVLSDGRKLAHAGFSLGNHQGASWAYRLAPSGAQWEIDARLESRNALP